LFLQPFIPPENLQEAIVRLRAAEEKAAEAEFLQMALQEKTLEKQFDETVK